MKAIYKYRVDEGINEAPIEKFLTAQRQGHHFVVWAVINDELPVRSFDLLPIWTGEAPPIDGEYINTIQDGYMVYHIYAVERVK